MNYPYFVAITVQAQFENFVTENGRRLCTYLATIYNQNYRISDCKEWKKYE